VGDVGLTLTEQKSHFSMWCLVTAPLLAGDNVIHMSNETLAILTAPEVIAVNQDSMAKQGIRVSSANKTGGEVWARLLSGGSVAVALLNRGSTEETITAVWTDIFLNPKTTATIRDLWEMKDVGEATGQFSMKVESHGVFMFKATPHQ
jgi:alpha-galactosidase